MRESSLYPGAVCRPELLWLVCELPKQERYMAGRAGRNRNQRLPHVPDQGEGFEDSKFNIINSLILCQFIHNQMEQSRPGKMDDIHS